MRLKIIKKLLKQIQIPGSGQAALIVLLVVFVA